MKNTRTVVIGEGTETPLAVTVRELPVKEIRAWVEEAKKAPLRDLIDSILLKDLSLSDLMLMSTLSAEQIDLLPPSQLSGVCEAVKEINADFFKFREKIIEMVTISKVEKVSEAG